MDPLLPEQQQSQSQRPPSPRGMFLVDGQDDPVVWRQNLNHAAQDPNIKNLALVHLHLSDIDWEDWSSMVVPRTFRCIQMVDCWSDNRVVGETHNNNHNNNNNNEENENENAEHNNDLHRRNNNNGNDDEAEEDHLHRDEEYPVVGVNRVEPIVPVPVLPVALQYLLTGSNNNNNFGSGGDEDNNFPSIRSSWTCESFYLSLDEHLTVECGQSLAWGLEPRQPQDETMVEAATPAAAGLRRLCIASVGWTLEVLEPFSIGLAHTTTLQELNLSYSTFSSTLVDDNDDDDDNNSINNINNNEQQQQDDGTTATTTSQELRRLRPTSAIQALAEYGLQYNSSLLCLRFNRCQLEDSDIAILVTSLQNHKTLQELFLGGNSCSIHGIRALSTLLKQNRIITLGLSNCIEANTITSMIHPNNNNNDNHHHHHHPHDDRHHVPLLGGGGEGEGEPTQQLPQQQQQRIRQDCFQILLEALKVNSSLQVLHLSSSHLHDDDMFQLGLALSTTTTTTTNNNNRQLRHLDLKNNHMTDVGMKLFCQYGVISCQLQKLWLLGNAQLTPIGVHHLVQVLESSHVELIDVRIPTYAMGAYKPNPVMRDEQATLRYYSRLNKGGRRLVLQARPNNSTRRSAIMDNNKTGTSSYTKNNTCKRNGEECGAVDCKECKYHDDETEDRTQSVMAVGHHPMGIWPLVLERVNRMEFGREYNTKAGQAEVIYYLLSQSPILWHR